MEEELKILENFFEDRMDVEEEKWALERLSITFRLLNSKLIHLSDEEYRNVIDNAQKELKEENKELKEYIKRLDELNSKDFILKSEVKEMIENRQKRIEDIRSNLYINQASLFELGKLETEIIVLQQLLEEGEN